MVLRDDQVIEGEERGGTSTVPPKLLTGSVSRVTRWEAVSIKFWAQVPAGSPLGSKVVIMRPNAGSSMSRIEIGLWSGITSKAGSCGSVM